MRAVLAAVTVVGLGSVAATIWVGARLMERTVVEDPYEHGLHHDEERRARARLGWRARIDREALQPGAAPFTFTLVDGAGAPVEGASVAVALSRPAGGGEDRRGQARPLGGGRYGADLAFPTPGLWDVRLDVRRGADEAGLVQQVRVEGKAAPPCDLRAGPCAAAAGPFQISLDLGRSLLVLQDMPILVEVRRGGAPVDGAAVEVSFAMKDMAMGENRVVLQPAGPGRYQGAGVLVRCASGRLDWIATVSVRAAGAGDGSARFPFAVRE